jgi:hypothetical protein
MLLHVVKAKVVKAKGVKAKAQLHVVVKGVKAKAHLHVVVKAKGVKAKARRHVVVKGVKAKAHLHVVVKAPQLVISFSTYVSTLEHTHEIRLVIASGAHLLEIFATKKRRAYQRRWALWLTRSLRRDRLLRWRRSSAGLRMQKLKQQRQGDQCFSDRVKCCLTLHRDCGICTSCYVAETIALPPSNGEHRSVGLGSLCDGQVGCCQATTK